MLTALRHDDTLILLHTKTEPEPALARARAYAALPFCFRLEGVGIAPFGPPTALSPTLTCPAPRGATLLPAPPLRTESTVTQLRGAYLKSYSFPSGLALA